MEQRRHRSRNLTSMFIVHILKRNLAFLKTILDQKTQESADDLFVVLEPRGTFLETKLLFSLKEIPMKTFSLGISKMRYATF